MSGRKTKSSSGDMKNVNHYMRKYRGEEVTTSKITRKGDQVTVKIIKKIL